MLYDEYICPACNSVLRQNATDNILKLVCDSNHAFTINDNIPDFTYPYELMASDSEFKSKYNATAENYDTGMDWLFNCFYEKEDAVRNGMIDFLEIEPAQRILEVGCGTGQDSLYIAKRLNKNGILYMQDLSAGMIGLAREKLKNVAPEAQKKYFVSNASYLPFPDNYFDALYHFGGLNTFSELEKAILEMTRVVKVGGKLVIGDEGVAPWFREDEYGKILIKANPLYNHEPPIELIPKNAYNVSIHWVLGNAFYVISYKKGEKVPALNLDLPIPGARGGTLRSRYYGSAESVKTNL